MAMISLRRFWSAAPPGDTTEFLRIIRLLLQGVALHSVEGDREDHEKFRRDLKVMLESTEADPSPSNLLIATGAALKTLEDYNHDVTRFVRTQGVELQHMISMLTHTVASLGAGSERSLNRLREIEGQLEKASVLEDVRMLKLRMEQCLEGIRDEAKRQKTESSQTVETLKQEIQESQERIRSVSAPRLDAVTGLPVRGEAENALQTAAQGAASFFAVVFVVDRVSVINSRFGYAIGDRVLRIYVDELKTRVAASDSLYRWSGPALMMLIQRSDPLEKVRDQLRSVVPKKGEHTVQLPQRTVLLPVSATWTVFSVANPIEGLLQQMDSFVASQGPAEA
jgi:GGDEF domain-containing protein